jgi:hypothetical protein
MTQIGIFGGRLKVEILGWHKLWSFKNRFDLPLDHVVSVNRLENERGLGGLRMPGTAIPGIITAGSYYGKGKWTFWDVCNKQNAVVIGLQSERYTSLVIETADPENAIAAIRTAINRPG